MKPIIEGCQTYYPSGLGGQRVRRGARPRPPGNCQVEAWPPTPLALCTRESGLGVSFCRPRPASTAARIADCFRQPSLHDRWELGVPSSEQWPSLQPSAGLATLGNLSRLTAVGERLRRGCSLRSAALGGSSTAGHALQRWSPALFHALLARRVNATFPHAARHAQKRFLTSMMTVPPACLATFLLGLQPAWRTFTHTARASTVKTRPANLRRAPSR